MLALILYLVILDRRKTKKFLFSLFLSLYLGFQFNLFLDLGKCVDCYGDELCRFFQNGQIHLTWFGYVLSIINPNLTKSVYHGVFNTSRVVIKRKTQRFRLNDNLENVIICPSVQNVQFLYNNIRGKLWSNFSTSIEPLLLKYFESMPEWPFPKYLGACGYLIVEENKGQPLSNFIESDFKTRASLAIEILKMANLFTFGHSEYIFYFTDYSFDNLVVDSNGRVFLIDLDNVIISSRSKGVHSSKGIHRSEILDEKNYAFSPSDICSHYLSDHNFFSVCMYLLSHPDNGLLKTIPGDVKDSVELSHLLNECTQSEASEGRFSAGKDLQSILEKIIGSL